MTHRTSHQIADLTYAEMSCAARMDGVDFDGEQEGFIKQALSDAVLEGRSTLDALAADCFREVYTLEQARELLAKVRSTVVLLLQDVKRAE